MAKWTIPDDLIPRSEAERMAQEARGAALKEAAVMVDQKYIALGRYGLRDAILSLDPDAVRAHDEAIREAVQPYRIALADAIRRPMGVVPASAEGLVTTAELDAAEERRAAIRARGETPAPSDGAQKGEGQ